MTRYRTGRLDIHVTGARATLSGRLDDAMELGELVARLPAGDVVIDAGGVTFVNSIGMRAWIRLVRALRQRGAVTLEAVSDVLIVQMNLITEFRGVHIASFLAVYACPACGREATVRVDAEAHAASLRAMVAPRLPCAECGAQMELAEVPERYLSIFRP
jgi:anti-anti-sigma regulatory factor/DNA-directed RNA polymerase subunit RPC12/RpoP